MTLRKRRRICRSAFLCGCLLPTVAILCWAIWLRTPWHAVRQAEWIEQQIAARVSLEAVRHPRPMTTACHALRLSDPENGQCLLVLYGVECVHRGGRNWTLSARRAELNVPLVPFAWDGLTRALKSCAERSLRVAASEVVFNDGTSKNVLGHLRGRFQSGKTQSLVELGVWLSSDPSAGQKDEEGVLRLRGLREHAGDSPATQWDVDARSVAIPCGILRDCLPFVERLGRDCRFRGYVWTRRQSGRWTSELVGELMSLDLAALVADVQDGQLSGTADVVLERAVLDGGRIEQLKGRVTAGPGRIGAMLCRSAAESLQLTPVAGFSHAGTDQPLDYRQLAFAFQLNSDGLWLEGRCDDAPAGTLLVDLASARPCLAASPRRPQPVWALVRAAAPPYGPQPLVPLTPATARLASLLPVDAPPSTAKTGSDLERR